MDSIGSIDVENTIGPSIVMGDYTESSDGILEIEVDDTPQISDQTIVMGDAFIDGYLQIHPFPGIYLDNTSYVFLTANSITGSHSVLPSALTAPRCSSRTKMSSAL